MRHYRVLLIDAFTTTPLQGNGCVVLTDARGLSEAEMQRIAREMNQSETSFVLPSTAAGYRLRYFTPVAEIPLAGHPTIATVHALAEEGLLPLQGEVTEATIELSVGVLPVQYVRRPGAPARVVMTQKEPVFGATYPHAQVAEALGLAVEDLRSEFPVQVVSTGTPQLMVLARDLGVLERARPDAYRIEALSKAWGFFSLHLFCLGGYASDADTHARHFAPEAGIAEDPFTGSASGGMGAYIVHYGLHPGPRLRLEQGHICGRPGTGEVEVVGPPEDIETVRISGSAVTVLRGELTLP